MNFELGAVNVNCQPSRLCTALPPGQTAGRPGVSTVRPYLQAGEIGLRPHKSFRMHTYAKTCL